MEETYYYNCDYCQKEFVPTRRGVQRFCKPSCKTRSHQKKRIELFKLQNQLAIAERAANSNQTEMVVSGDAFNTKKEDEQSLAVITNQTEIKPKKEKQKIEKMSMAGVGNAALGFAAVDALKAAFTKEEDKPVSKKEMLVIFNHLDQNQRVIYDLIIKQENEFKPENFG